MSRSAAKRIIFLPYIDAFGGAERLVLDLSRFLFEKDVPHLVACFRSSIDLQAYADWPLHLHETRPKRSSLSEARSLHKFLALSDRPAAVPPLLFDLKSAFYSGILSPKSFFLHLTDPPSLLPSDVSKYSGSARRMLPEFRDLPETKYPLVLRGEVVHRLNRRGMKLASKVIVMTEKIRRELRHLYGVDALVVRPGISPNGFTLEPAPRSGPIRILSVSRLEPNKRIDWILRALATLGPKSVSNHSGWRLEIAGAGPAAESLEKLAGDLGILDQVVFLGHISNDELAKVYSRTSLFLMPAAQGYGLPALDALNRGIPTVVHKDSGVSEILRDNPCVEIIDGQIEGLVSAIETMFDRVNNQTSFPPGGPAIPKSYDWAKGSLQHMRVALAPADA